MLQYYSSNLKLNVLIYKPWTNCISLCHSSIKTRLSFTMQTCLLLHAAECITGDKPKNGQIILRAQWSSQQWVAREALLIYQFLVSVVILLQHPELGQNSPNLHSIIRGQFNEFGIFLNAINVILFLEHSTARPLCQCISPQIFYQLWDYCIQIF